MKLLVANAAITLLLRKSQAKPRITGSNLSRGASCEYGTRFQQCSAGNLCGSEVVKSFREENYYTDQNVQAFFDWTTGERFSTSILKDKQFTPNDEVFDSSVNGPLTSSQNAVQFDNVRGFRDFRTCQGIMVKDFEKKSESDCVSFCKNESGSTPASKSLFFCCQHEGLATLGDFLGQCTLHEGNRVQKAENDQIGKCIAETDCGQNVPQTNGNKVYRCDAWTAQVDRNDYRNTLDKTAESNYERDMASAKQNFQMEKYQIQPTGWTANSYISLEKLGIYPNVRSQLTSAGSQISTNGCGTDSWCTNDSGKSERRTCAISVKFKIDSQSQQVIDTLTESCEVHDLCEAWNNNNDLKIWVACPQLQCPTHTYRSGLYNIDQDLTGKFIFRSGTRLTYNDDGVTTYRYREYEQSLLVLDNKDRWNEQPSAQTFNRDRFYPVITPFKCVPDFCERERGLYVQKGNTDTGQIWVEDEGVQDPNDRTRTVKRIVIPPRYILTYVEQFDSSGRRFQQNQLPRNPSNNQGKCGQCLAFQIANNRQPVVNSAYLLEDEPDIQTNGVMANKIRQTFYPPVVAFVSKGCTRCPDFLKRDQRTSLSNGKPNPNYGYCYRQNCNGNGILVRGESRDNYKDQGECIPCPSNKILNTSGTSCIDCLDYQAIITNRQGIKICQEPACRIGFYTDKNQGIQRRCPDYLTTTSTVCRDRCEDPRCSTQNRSFITQRDGTCGPCPSNQEPDTSDTQNRRCRDIPCGEYERRQTSGQYDGQCRPDTCPTGQYNLRYDDTRTTKRQGECERCNANEENRTTPLIRDNRIFRYECRACLVGQIFTNGVCRSCPNDEFAQNNRCVCDYWTRRQTNNLCRSDNCSDRQYLIIGSGQRESDRLQGTCQACPNGERSQTDRRSCQSVVCPRNQLKTPDARCVNCPQLYRYPNSQQTTCFEPICTTNPPNSQYISREGFCVNCPSDQIVLAVGQRDRCNSCTCNSYLDRSLGVCRSCGNRSVVASSRDRCTPIICNSQQIYGTGSTNSGGAGCPAIASCIDCRAFTRAQDANSRCGPDPCPEAPRRGQIRSDGTCEKCPDYEIIISGVCRRQPCASPGYLTNNGECIRCDRYQEVSGESCVPKRCYQARYFLGGVNDDCILCPARTVPSTNQRICVTPICPQAISEDGQCIGCNEYERFNPTTKICENPNCRPPTYVARTGECVRCPNYQSVSPNGRDCIPCNCEDPSTFTQANNQGRGSKCMIDGSCQACPNYTRLVITGANPRRDCQRPACQINEIVTIYGTCQSCAPCERLNAARTQCVRQNCVGNKSILQQNGTCKTCSNYQYVNTAISNFCGGGDCDRRVCPSRSRLLTNGDCEACPNYQVVSTDGYQCVLNVCTNPNEIQDISGTCRPCQPYYRPDNNRRTCINTCPDDTYINQYDGQCKKCSIYYRADSSKTNCIRDNCITPRQYFDPRGFCLPCKTCTRALVGNEQCAPDKCSDRQVLNSDGACTTCQTYFRPSAVNTCGATCIQCTPKDTEIRTENGFCTPCQAYTRGQSGNTVCGPDICDLRSRLTTQGTCTPCNDFSRGNGRKEFGTFIDCQPDKCTGNQVLQIDGTCSICDNYYRANADNTACIMPKCVEGNGRQVLSILADWRTCEPYTRADDLCRVCRPDPCTLRQKLLPDGTCTACSAYQRADASGRGCEEIKCFTRTKVLIDGTQEDCPPFMHSTTDCRACVADTCSVRQRLLDTGFCEDCELYTRSQGDGRQCAPNICTQRQRLLEDGTCEDCKDYTRAFYEGKKCGNTPCTAREILQIDGRCAPCYPYTRASEDGKTCVPHGCTDRQRLTTGGQCTDCPAYTRAQGDGTKCGPDACNLRQRILENGTCQYCPLYSRVCKDQRCCDRPKCQPYQVLYKDGTCQECAFHEMVDPIDGTRCVIDPNKKVSDPIPAPTVQLQTAVEPACCTTAGCDVWSDDQLLAEDQASGFYLNQNSGNLGFILGNARKLSLAAVSIVSAVLIAVYAI